MTLWEIAGWSGNAFFFGRFLVQWLVSERAGRSLAPRSFWWMSLAGVFLLGSYNVHQGEVVLLAGSLINGGVYVRNLMLDRGGIARSRLGPSETTILAVLGVCLLIAVGTIPDRVAGPSTLGWILCVAIGQALWSSRFLLQWWFVERRGYSHFPVSFWWISLSGNLLLLAYALHLRNPVYVAGFLPGPIVQVRNLILARRAARRPGLAAPSPRPRLR